MLALTEDWVQRLRPTNLNLAILPARNLDNRVDDSGVLLVRVKGHIVPERDWLTLVLEPYSPFLMPVLVLRCVHIKSIIPECCEPPPPSSSGRRSQTRHRQDQACSLDQEEILVHPVRLDLDLDLDQDVLALAGRRQGQQRL